MNAKEIFDKLVQKAYGFRWRWGRSSKRPIGVPGELVNGLSEEDRQILQNLKADDISASKVSQGEVEIFEEYNPATDALKIIEEFDQKIVRQPLRKKRYEE